MSLPRVLFAASALSAALFTQGCANQHGATAPAASLPVTDAATFAAIDRTLTGDHRSTANRARDVYRHPRETLAFFGLRQDLTVL